MTNGVGWGIKELREQIEVTTAENLHRYRSMSLDYRCHTDTTKLNALRLERTGSVPVGRFPVTGIVAEERVRQMYVDNERRREEIERLCQFQRDLNLILKVANDGGDIEECWRQFHSVWERYNTR